MSLGLSKLRISVLKRRSNANDQGRLVDMLMPLLRQQDACVELVDVERGQFHRLGHARRRSATVSKKALQSLHIIAQ